MKNHLNIEQVVVVLSIRTALNSHNLLIIIEHLVEFEASIKLILRCRQLINVYLWLCFRKTDMLRNLSDGCLLYPKFSLAVG